MLGAEGVVNLILARAATAMPGKLTQLRARYQCSVVDLPDLKAIMSTDYEVDTNLTLLPCMWVQDNATATIAVQEKSRAGTWFEVTYQIGVYLAVRATDPAATATQRRRMTVAVREMLLERPQLTALETDQYVTLDEGSLSEQQSSVRGKDSQWRSLVAVDGVWRAQEYLPRPSSATVGTISDLGSTVTTPLP